MDDAVKRADVEELTNKVSRCNKLMESFKGLEEKLGNATASTVVDDKEKMDEIFAKKQIGRPAGTWENKRAQYLQMLKKGKISQPKPATLEYHKIIELDGEYMMEAITTKKREWKLVGEQPYDFLSTVEHFLGGSYRFFSKWIVS